MSGKRNEPARARRRRKQREQLSMISMVRDEARSKANHSRLTLDNHFGWRVLYKTQLDDSASMALLNLYEKPDSTGGDFQKVTYVVYMDKEEMIDREMAIKHTQTEPVTSGVLREKKAKRLSKTILVLPPKEPEKEETVEDTRSEPSRRSLQQRISKTESISERMKPQKKRKLISDFYHKPRSKSRSKFTEIGDSNEETLRSETTLPEEEWEDIKKEIELEKQQWPQENKPKKKGKGHDRWALRAGAENTNGELGNTNKASERKLSSVVRIESKLIKRLKSVWYRREPPSEHLLQTHSGTNQYLYVWNERKKKADEA